MKYFVLKWELFLSVLKLTFSAAQSETYAERHTTKNWGGGAIDAGVYSVTVGFTPAQNYTKEVNTGVAARLEATKN